MEKSLRIVLLYACAVLLLCSCASPAANDGDLNKQATLKNISCMAVLPVSSSVDQDDTIGYKEARSLEKGEAYADQVLQRELQGNPKVHFFTSGQLATLVPEISGGIIGTDAALGQKLHCDTVLMTTLRRYKQREGTEYSVDAPAAVDFSMVLRDTTNGKLLWYADVREKQESFLENIFSFSKAKKRGFKWISVEQLLEQGIKEKLAECPYLK